MPASSDCSRSIAWGAQTPDQLVVSTTRPGLPPYGVLLADDEGLDFVPTTFQFEEATFPGNVIVSAAGDVAYVTTTEQNRHTVWRSDDAGVTWDKRNADIEANEAVLIAVDPSDANVVYMELVARRRPRRRPR